MKADYLISATAEQRGFGTDRYKVIVHLTKSESDAGKTGTPVFFRSTAISGGTHGTYWRQAVWNARGLRFIQRVPDANVVAMLESESEAA